MNLAAAIQGIDVYDSHDDLHDIINECNIGVIPMGQITFLLPTAEQVETIKAANEDKKTELINSYILNRRIKDHNDFRTHVTNKLGIDIKCDSVRSGDQVFLSNSKSAQFTIKKTDPKYDKDDITFWKVISGAPPTDGDKGDLAVGGARGRSYHHIRGGSDARVTYNNLLQQEFNARMIERARDKAVACYLSPLVNFIVRHTSDAKRLCSNFSYDVFATYYLLFEPYKESNHCVSDIQIDDVFSTKMHHSPENLAKFYEAFVSQYCSGPSKVTSKDRHDLIKTPNKIHSALRTYYENSEGDKKLWQDALRFVISNLFIQLLKNYEKDAYEEICMSLCHCWPGNNYEKEFPLPISNIAGHTDVIALVMFVRSNYLLYTPCSKEEAGRPEDQDQDIRKQKIHNYDAVNRRFLASVEGTNKFPSHADALEKFRETDPQLAAILA